MDFTLPDVNIKGFASVPDNKSSLIINLRGSEAELKKADEVIKGMFGDKKLHSLDKPHVSGERWTYDYKIEGDEATQRAALNSLGISDATIDTAIAEKQQQRRHLKA